MEWFYLYIVLFLLVLVLLYLNIERSIVRKIRAAAHRKKATILSINAIDWSELKARNKPTADASPREWLRWINNGNDNLFCDLEFGGSTAYYTKRVVINRANRIETYEVEVRVFLWFAREVIWNQVD